MPWNEVSTMSLRREFVALASQPDANISELCRRFEISRKTGYKWLHRRSSTSESYANRSTRPHTSPRKTSIEMEQLIIDRRRRYPEWGGRKLKRLLENEGHSGLPSPSTITEILRRHDLLGVNSATTQANWQRFEHAAPNDLWQMDFKGPITTGQHTCHALTVLDDHSRYSLGIKICASQMYTDTRQALTEVFRHHGLPHRMTMDNGNPWGNSRGRWTRFSAWLIDQGIGISFSRPYHPQTQGKDERFHRSLKAELLSRQAFANSVDLQERCDRWRTTYNEVRPHDALALGVPLSRYRPSERSYQEQVPSFEYAPNDIVRRVTQTGMISYGGRLYPVSEAFRQRSVGLRPTDKDGVLDVFYRHQRVAKVDLRTSNV